MFTSTFYDLGPAPYNSILGTFPTQGLVEGISLEKKPKFSIVGNVWVDSNRNGAKDIGEANYPNATITLSGPVSTTTTTDASGNYSFGNLTAGNYTVALTLPGGYAATTTNPVNVVISQTVPSTTVNFGIVFAEIQIFAGRSTEPYVAVDPNDGSHAVIGFNDLSSPDQGGCGWAELQLRTDASTLPSTGSLQLPTGFKPIGDPWVRYGPDGTLFYTCIGRKTDFSRTVDGTSVTKTTWRVFLAASPPASGQSGRASALRVTATVAETTQICVQGVCLGSTTDHPSLGVLRTSNGSTRLIACWTESKVSTSTAPLPGFLLTNIASSNDGGVTWSIQTTKQGARQCTVGAGNGIAGVAYWYNNQAVLGPILGSNNLRLLTSTDAVSWSGPITLASVGPLLSNGTTDKVLSQPYALLAPNANRLQAIYQVRVTDPTIGDHSQVFVVDVDPATGRITSGSQPGVPGSETFLPGAGTCPNLVGMYQATPASNPDFRYTVWSFDVVNNTWRSRFQTSRGPIVSLARIGDYTGADCSSSRDVAWVAWADARDGDPHIWGAAIPIR